MKKCILLTLLIAALASAQAQTIVTGSLTGPICAGSSFEMPYTESAFPAGTVFMAQLSDSTGSFGIPDSIGINTPFIHGVVPVTIPAGAHGSAYRIRIVSATNPMVISTNTNGSNLVINAIPPAPVLMMSGVGCLGLDSLLLSGASGASQIAWNFTAPGIDSTVGISFPYQAYTVAGGNGSNPAGPNSADQLTQPYGVFVDSSGYIYATDANVSNPRIQKFPPNSTGSTNGVTIAGGNGYGNGLNQLQQPQGVFVDDSGYIYVSDYDDVFQLNSRILKFPGTGPAAGVIMTGPNQVKDPVGIFVNSHDTVYVADNFNTLQDIRRFSPGNVNGAAIVSSDYPAGVYMDSHRDLYVTDNNSNNPRVVKYSVASHYATGMTIAGGNGPQGNAANQFSNLFGIFVDTAGNVYVADANNNRIQKFLAGSSCASSGITVAGGNGRGNAANQLNRPLGVHVDPAGNIFVADAGNNRIQKFTQAPLDTVFYPSSAGTYTATYTSLGGCVSALSNPVVIPDSLVPSVTVSASDTAPCVGAQVTFTAIPVYGGSTPSYQWYKNNSPAGSNASVFTTSFNFHDSIWVSVTSSLPCAVPSTAASSPMGLPVRSVGTAVSVSPPPFALCAGTPEVLVARPIHGGSAPSYQWYKNGLPVGTNDSVYTDAAPVNNDNVWVSMSSSLACPSPAAAISNTVLIVVNPLVAPAVSISTPASQLCPAMRDTFTAAVINGGGTPAYQWYKNGTAVGNNGPGYSDPAPANNDSVWVVVTSNLACASPTTAVSNTIGITITSSLIPSVHISAPATTLCGAVPDTFTAAPVNGGNAPSYQWYKNGAAAGTNAPVFSDPAPANNDNVWVVMTSNLACANPTTATGNTMQLTVNPATTPAVSISVPSTVLCARTPATFTATATNAGNSPSYQWYKNGIAEPGNDPTYTDTALTDHDSIWVVMSGGMTCGIPVNAGSDTIQMTVNPLTSPSVSITASANIIRSAAADTFTAVVINGGSAPTLQWYINDSAVGTNDTILTSAPLPAGDSVYVVITSSELCTLPPTATAQFILQTPTSTVSVAAQSDIDLYPNPNNGSFVLQAGNNIGSGFDVYDMLGRKVAERSITAEREFIQLQNLPAGVYTLTIREDDSKALRFTVNP